jgi:hypothetical protein
MKWFKRVGLLFLLIGILTCIPHARSAENSDPEELPGKTGNEGSERASGLGADIITVPHRAGGITRVTPTPSPYADSPGTVRRRWHPAIGAVDHSSAEISGAFAWMVKQIGSNKATIEMPAGTYAFNEDYTVPDNIEIVPQYGTLLAPAAGKTLTVSAKMRPVRFQVFSGAGRVVFGEGAIGVIYPEMFGAAPGIETNIDSGPAFSKAVAAGEWNSAISGRGTYNIKTPIVISQKPVTLRGEGQMGMVLKKDPLNTGAVIYVDNCRRAGAAQELNNGTWWEVWDTPNYDFNGASITNVVLEGDSRRTRGSGIVFRGVNADFILRDVQIWNFKGSGIKACDPYGATGPDAAAGNAMWESRFENVLISNCGYNSGVYATSEAALEIGRNELKGPNHNNLKVYDVSVGYPRWIGVRILNRSTTSNIHKIQFRTLWVHGNRNLALDPDQEPDRNGETWLTGANLIEIGNIPGVTSDNVGDLRTVSFTDCYVLQQEENMSGVYVGRARASGFKGATIAWIGGSVEAADTGIGRSFGIRFNQAGTSLVSGLHYDSRKQPANLIRVDEMSDAYETVVLGLSSMKPRFGRVSDPFISIGDRATLDNVSDETVKVTTLLKTVPDSLPFDNYPAGGGVYPVAGGDANRYLRRAYFIPKADLAASDTDFAELILSNYDETGGLQSIGVTATKTRASGGTGNWSVRVPVELTLPGKDFLYAGGSMEFSIAKQGGGVIVPAGMLVVETSQYKYQANR